MVEKETVVEVVVEVVVVVVGAIAIAGTDSGAE
jgi:hypothetical protein